MVWGFEGRKSTKREQRHTKDCSTHLDSDPDSARSHHHHLKVRVKAWLLTRMCTIIMSLQQYYYAIYIILYKLHNYIEWFRKCHHY